MTLTSPGSPAVTERNHTNGMGRRNLKRCLARLAAATTEEERDGLIARLKAWLPTDPAALGDLLRPGELRLVAAWIPTHRQGALRALLVDRWLGPHEYQMMFNLLLDVSQELPLVDQSTP